MATKIRDILNGYETRIRTGVFFDFASDITNSPRVWQTHFKSQVKWTVLYTN